jgi:hypothetical protein
MGVGDEMQNAKPRMQNAKCRNGKSLRSLWSLGFGHSIP